jgi:hypothetical protein
VLTLAEPVIVMVMVMMMVMVMGVMKVILIMTMRGFTLLAEAVV